MKNVVLAAGALALGASAAVAGGIERTAQSAAVLFEQGNYLELSFGSVMPRVSGVGAGTVRNGAQPTPGVPSGDMAVDYSQIAGAAKFRINDNIDAAVIFDTPFGANVNYPLTGYYASGATADLKTTALTGLLKYRFPSNFSVFGGLRYQTLQATASVPFVAGYGVNGARDGAVGFVGGIAYEKPEIALRVALTYNSEITHALPTTESVNITESSQVNAIVSMPSSVTTVVTPQSVNLEFQSGVAKNTLVFGSVRWVEWSAFKIDPAGYPPASPLVSYDADTITYALGVGRKLNENWAVAASIGYEKPTGGFASNLGPTDGKTSLTLGATYTRGSMKVTGGVTYVDVGKAQTTLAAGLPAGTFSGNSALGIGVKFGFSF